IEGPILRANLYAGEVFDATKQIPQWADAHTDASSWKHAQVAQGIIPQELRPQLIEPIRMQQEIAPVSLWKDSAGNWIYDFGVNVAAIPCLTVEQPSGTRIKMRMGENLNPNRTIDFSTTGPGATGVIQTDEYICAGTGRESWTPRFTYHGFRYLELSGAATEPQLSWLKAITVYTDVQPRGSFECANPQINRLHEMAVRTMLSNIHGLPTDCPHRERCGWLGDAHAVAPFENCNFNMENFWLKYLEDIHSSSSVFLENTLHQKLYNSEFYFADKQPGIPFMISPGRRLCGVASPDWGTAVVQLPWYVYLYYGSTEALERYYPEMKQWVDHIEALTENHIVPYGLGDWCPPDGNAAIDCPIPLSSSLFHYLDASLLSQSAKALGKTEDANHYAVLAEQIGHAICKKFYDPQKKSFGSQTANAMALSFGVVPAGDEEAVSAAIVENMALYHDFIHTGIFGLGHIGQALSRYGHAAEAWRVFTKTGEHSFAWMWENPISEATTLWETLPVSNSSAAVGLKASLNHPMEAVFDTWFYEDILGIRPDASAPGFKVVRLDPTLTASLSWAKGSIETPYGKVSSSWKQTDGRLEWEIQIPANASGLVALPVGKAITIDGAAWDEGLFPVVLQRPDANLCRFPSGDYVITAQ
ncbi:MAG: family 78 glycoside hydrolase catalytic domain, partial [Alistipes sp.]|nr:family 78 glycoside hydrolase catalytic domain [Alistipes sp.]